MLVHRVLMVQRCSHARACACVPKAIYGFAMSYRYTQSKLYLDTARKTASYFIARVNARFTADHVPAYDLDDVPAISPTNLTERDASAAAIAASGLLELAQHGGADNEAYVALAAEMLQSLVLGSFSTRDLYNETEGAVQHCNALDTDVPWSDYYLAEAILRWRTTRT